MAPDHFSIVASVPDPVLIAVALIGVRHARTVVVAVRGRAASAGVVGILAVQVAVVQDSVLVEIVQIDILREDVVVSEARIGPYGVQSVPYGDRLVIVCVEEAIVVYAVG